MSPEQATQIAQYSFLAILVIPSLITLGVGIVVAWMVVPKLLKQMQQLSDNNFELTKIARQNSDQNTTTQATLSGIVPELAKQTKAIETQTEKMDVQGFDFKSYQSLVNDGMSLQTNAIEAMQQSLMLLPAQIVKAIKDEMTCQTILTEFSTLRAEVTRAMFQQNARDTGTFRAVPTSPTPQPALPTAPLASDDKQA